MRDLFSGSRSHPSRISSVLTIVVIIITSVNQIESVPDLPLMITWQFPVPMGPSSRQFFIFGFMVFVPYVLPEHFTLVFLVYLIYTQSPAPTSHHCCHGHSNCHYKIIRKKRRLGVIHHRHRNKTVKIFTTSSSSKVGQWTTESTVPLLVKSSSIKPSTELPNNCLRVQAVILVPLVVFGATVMDTSKMAVRNWQMQLI